VTPGAVTFFPAPWLAPAGWAGKVSRMFPAILLAFAAMFLSGAFGIATYRLTRHFWPVIDKPAMELAGIIIVRIGILHALIVALAFTEVRSNETLARQSVADEAVTVADVFLDLERFGGDATLPERRLLVRYARDVVRSDWPALDIQGQLSPEAGRSWQALIDAMLLLQPTDRRQEMILSHLMSNGWKLGDQRQRREAAVHALPHPVLWFTSIMGLLIICGCLAPFPPRRSTHVLIAAFSAFTGAVLYLAYDVTTPFHGLWTIHPTGLENFLRQPGAAALLTGG
jgi:hypothetical protein